MATNGNGLSVWKAIAIFLSGVVIAGVPSAISSLTGPSAADVRRVEAQVASAQIELARVAARQEIVIAQQKETRDQLDELRRLIIESTRR